ncbi:MAG: hypothetical protein VZS44_09860 [Bacilli bacterium]|nr:hypothetical protein [Bacilli bacterium]
MESESCYRCKYWSINEYTQKKYGEGNGMCAIRKEITFCDKHNCILFNDKTDGKENKEL